MAQKEALPFGHRPNDHRVEDSCTVCGQVDNHPKHHVFDAKATPQYDTHHLDCGAGQGCEVCTQSEGLSGGKRGDELIAHVDISTTSGRKHAEAVAEALGMATASNPVRAESTQEA